MYTFKYISQHLKWIKKLKVVLRQHIWFQEDFERFLLTNVYLNIVSYWKS